MKKNKSRRANLETFENQLPALFAHDTLVSQTLFSDHYEETYRGETNSYRVLVKHGKAQIFTLPLSASVDCHKKSPFKRKAPRATDNQPTGGCSLTSLKGQ